MRRRLQRVALPDEQGARKRAWAVVRAAYAERDALPAPRRRLWPLAAAAALLALAAAALSPPGRAVLDSLRRAVGVEHAQPALFSLPAEGRLLAVAPGGAWVVHADGSKRRLGAYRDAAWSPYGHFIAATTANELRALEPDGGVRWTLARPEIRTPRWGGSRTDTRLAYVSRDGLRVVAGDGTGDRLLAPAERGPLAWRPGPRRELAYVSASELRLQDTDSGRVLWRATTGIGPGATGLSWSADGRRLVVFSALDVAVFDARGRVLTRSSASEPTFAAAALSPTGRLAFVKRSETSSAVVLGGRRVFAGTGAFRDLAWSPDGRWLLVTWPTADQLVFVPVSGAGRIHAVAAIGAQFGGFPRVSGWCCP